MHPYPTWGDGIAPAVPELKPLGEGDARYVSVGNRDYIALADGSTDLGEIPKDAADEIGLDQGPIRLPKGDANAGEIHLGRPGRIDQLRNAGFDDAAAFANHVAQNYSQIYEGKDGTLLLVERPESGKAHTLYVELTHNVDGHSWDINSGGVFRGNYPNAGGRTLLWERGRNPLAATDQQPPFGSAPNQVGGNTVNAQAQSSDPSIAPTPESGNASISGATTLTGSKDSEILAPRTDTFGHDFNALTNSEANYLGRYPSADAIRNRLVARGQEGIVGDDTGLSGEVVGGKGPEGPTGGEGHGGQSLTVTPADDSGNVSGTQSGPAPGASDMTSPFGFPEHEPPETFRFEGGASSSADVTPEVAAKTKAWAEGDMGANPIQASLQNLTQDGALNDAVQRAASMIPRDTIPTTEGAIAQLAYTIQIAPEQVPGYVAKLVGRMPTKEEIASSAMLVGRPLLKLSTPMPPSLR